MRNTKVKSLIVFVLLLALFFVSGKVFATELGYKVEYEEDSSGKYNITVNFDNEIDIEKFKADDHLSEEWNIVNSKQIKKNKPTSGMNTSTIVMKDGSRLQIGYVTPNLSELMGENNLQSNGNTEGNEEFVNIEKSENEVNKETIKTESNSVNKEAESDKKIPKTGENMIGFVITIIVIGSVLLIGYKKYKNIKLK